MGRTLESLSEKEVGKAIFNNRFVVECCEAFHVHYRNLRIVLSESDFISMAQGMRDALKRWEDRGKPSTSTNTHIELCRKQVASIPLDEGKLKINHNDNLYLRNEGKIFSEGAELEDKTYVHLKIRDLRLELTNKEFISLCEAIEEAKSKMVSHV